MRNSVSAGFTLIELMIVVAIVGILAAIAAPAYEEYVVRAKITEALISAAAVKTFVSEAFQADGLSGVTAAANTYNAKDMSEKASKYLKSIIVNKDTGAITIATADDTGSGLPTDALDKTITFTPNVKKVAIAATSGAIDWACPTTTNVTATARGLGAVTTGTLPARYAPAECR